MYPCLCTPAIYVSFGLQAAERAAAWSTDLNHGLKQSKAKLGIGIGIG